MNEEPDQEPLVVIAVRLDSVIRWFRSPRDLWVLDVNKWRDSIVAAGYQIPAFTDDYRFGMPCVDEHNVDVFLAKVAEYEVHRDQLTYELATRFPTARSWWDVGDLFPIAFIDFDESTVGGFYLDGVKMEQFLPDGWTGEFVDFANEYSEEIFPSAQKFWVKGDSDLLKLLNERGSTPR